MMLTRFDVQPRFGQMQNSGLHHRILRGTATWFAWRMDWYNAGSAPFENIWGHWGELEARIWRVYGAVRS